MALVSSTVVQGEKRRGCSTNKGDVAHIKEEEKKLQTPFGFCFLQSVEQRTHDLVVGGWGWGGGWLLSSGGVHH